MGFEENIKASFKDVKMDMISVKNQILKLAESQQETRDLILELQKSIENIKKTKSKKTVKKKILKKKKS
jgi:hypothetical protein